MRSTITLLSVLIGAAFAAPNSALSTRSTDTVDKTLDTYAPSLFCMSDSDAQDAADIFQELIQNYSDKLAKKTLTKDFKDYSSAVNIIMNSGNEGPKILTEPTFNTRKEFMDGQGSQPEIPFEQLNVFHGCDSVSVRWTTSRSAAGQATETDDLPVVGIAILETVAAGPNDKYNFRIKTIYSEFNAAAWLVNLGVFVPEETSEYKRSIGSSLRGNMI